VLQGWVGSIHAHLLLILLGRIASRTELLNQCYHQLIRLQHCNLKKQYLTMKCCTHPIFLHCLFFELSSEPIFTFLNINCQNEQKLSLHLAILVPKKENKMQAACSSLCVQAYDPIG
jgi:hypothetical protein